MSLGELVKLHAVKGIRSLKLLELMEAEVVAGPPDLKVKLKGSDKLIIPKELLVVAEHLCRTVRKVTVMNSGTTEVSSQSFKASVQIGAPVGKDDPIPPAHDHKADISVDLKGRKFDLLNGELHYINDDDEDDLLKAGDNVIVFSFEGGQKFFIFDRIVHY